MLNERDVHDSKSRGAVRLTLPIFAATLLVALVIGLGAASPALADRDYRGGAAVTVRAAFPLPFLFPFPIPVPVVHRTSYRNDHHDHGNHYGHYRDYDRHRGHARRGYRDDHRRYAKHAKRHKRGDRHDRHDGRRSDHRRH